MPDDRDLAGTASTVAPPADAGTDATVAAGAGTDATVAAGAGAGHEGTLAAPLAPVVLADLSVIAHAGSSGATTRTVGDDLRDASIERFDEVPRNRFELQGELARGGLGRVMRARDPRTGRVVALKEVLRPSPDLIARFAREAMVTANLQHPAIVPVYEVGRWPSGEPFYAMKLVSGGPLAASIDAAPSLADRTALLPHVIAVADALAYAHGEGIIHRDLKPANVMVGAHGETVVIDWGLARRVDQLGDIDTLPPIASAAPGETVVGAVLGTPVYMAPEQARGERVDARADVYAIGAMLYHLLAGRPPYGHLGTAAEVLAAVKAGPAPPLTAIAPAAPRELAAIVLRAMAHDAGARYPTAAALADDLRCFATGQLVSAHHYGRGERLRRFARRNRGALAIAAVAVAVAVAAVVATSARGPPTGWVARRRAATLPARATSGARRSAVARSRSATRTARHRARPSR